MLEARKNRSPLVDDFLIWKMSGFKMNEIIVSLIDKFLLRTPWKNSWFNNRQHRWFVNRKINALKFYKFMFRNSINSCFEIWGFPALNPTNFVIVNSTISCFDIWKFMLCDSTKIMIRLSTIPCFRIDLIPNSTISCFVI